MTDKELSQELVEYALCCLKEVSELYSRLGSLESFELQDLIDNIHSSSAALKVLQDYNISNDVVKLIKNQS